MAMAGVGAVQVKLELGHRAQVRKRPTVEGFTHDWAVFVRGPERSNIRHFVDKVVFYLHESFPRPRRVCKDPPYRVEESGYAGFILPIEVYFRNKEEPKRVRFDYDLFLHLEGHPPVNHIRCEKLIFNNPTEEFRRRVLKAGGQRDPHRQPTDDPKVTVLQEGSTRLSSQHLKPSTLGLATPTLANPKNKTFPSSKDTSRGSGGALLSATSASSSSTSSFSKLHKPSKDQRHKKEPKSASRDSAWGASRASKEPPGRPGETRLLQDINAKVGPKESRSEDEDPDPGLSKRALGANSDRRLSKKRKKGQADLSGRPRSGASDTEQSGFQALALRQGGRTVPVPPPFQELLEPGDSEAEDRPRPDLEQPSPASSTSSPGRGPTLRTGPEQQSDVNDEGSEEEQDVDSDVEPPARARLPQRPSRVAVSLSDGCESSSSSPSSPSHRKALPSLGTANHQAYLEELVELHRRLMALREGRVLQQVVNLIEETGHFHISSTTFDFDLCSLDRSTVRKLQSYLEAWRPS